ncbi:hypothetical protein Egran_02093 [Elaphomyces granulatus]|uniref:chitinase n=1 Tax=Elaphomyces granulatus TaxID=519963 RepID=A0A232M1A6_9EURO|nr:hypothetical protein Egran_02093 [Elaphomyces granulatus]
MWSPLLFGLLASHAAAMRFAMYIDPYHLTNLPRINETQGITHVIMALANSSLFSTDPAGQYTPFLNISDVRSMFASGTKVMISIGGFGDTAGLSAGAKDDASRERFAKNIADLIKKWGFEGCELDWEYPAGNGADYKQIPNSDKVSEIDTFPLLLKEIRKAIGDDKLLSVAVPGLKRDMIAYTAEKGPEIWPLVDFVNLMSYDLKDRRDTTTGHHTSIEGCLETVSNYLAIGLEPEKMNLGFAYYAKWFTTAADAVATCTANPIGCPMVPLENADGSDSGKSGAITFETANMAPPPANLVTASDGACGFNVKQKCGTGFCCSQSGFCGSSDAFCGAGCLFDYGVCKGVDVLGSWHKAQQNGTTDEQAGGQYYFDSSVNLFWTWDTPSLISRKFTEIVKAKNLGGVMAWSFGEDTYDLSHLQAMQQGVQNCKRRMWM